MYIEEMPFFRDFSDLAEAADRRGWHERNGGNLTYRLTTKEVKACEALFHKTEPWQALVKAEPHVGGEYYLVTGSGKWMRHVVKEPRRCAGIIEISTDGAAYRIVWGLEGQGRPTSELPTHLAVSALKKTADEEKNRVIYHAHPPYLIASTFTIPLDDAVFTRHLWEADIENPIVFPEGIGIVPWVLPGSREAAEATLEKMKNYRAVVWAQHGTFTCGDDFDDTFGLMEVLEKSAQIYCTVAAMGGKRQGVSTDNLRALEKACGLKLNEAALNAKG